MSRPPTPVLRSAFPADPEEEDDGFVDLESNLGAETLYYGTVTEQTLMLVTHFVRFVGLTFAVLINSVIFVPFFLLAIFPLWLIKLYRGSSAPELSPHTAKDGNSLNGTAKLSSSHSGGCSSCKCNVEKDGDVSPLALAADAPYQSPRCTSCKNSSSAHTATNSHLNANGNLEHNHKTNQQRIETNGNPSKGPGPRDSGDTTPFDVSAPVLDRAYAGAEVLMVKNRAGGIRHDRGFASGVHSIHNVSNDKSTLMKRR